MTKNIFDQKVSSEVIERINHLTPNSAPKWGKMGAAEMLAHCNVTYEYVYDNKYREPNAMIKLILKLFVKNLVVSDKPYKHHSQTAPDFIIKGDMDFEKEKTRLVDFISKTQQMGEGHFDGKKSHSFGVLNKTEWNNMFYKHLDHHLQQFGV